MDENIKLILKLRKVLKEAMLEVYIEHEELLTNANQYMYSIDYDNLNMYTKEKLDEIIENLSHYIGLCEQVVYEANGGEY